MWDLKKITYRKNVYVVDKLKYLLNRLIDKRVFYCDNSVLCLHYNVNTKNINFCFCGLILIFNISIEVFSIYPKIWCHFSGSEQVWLHAEVIWSVNLSENKLGYFHVILLFSLVRFYIVWCLLGYSNKPLG